MMKKKLFRMAAIILAVIISVAALPFAVSASQYYEDAENGVGISYVVRSDNTAALVGVWVQNYELLGDSYTLPETVDGYTVTEIRTDAVRIDVDRVTPIIPSSVTKIQNGAFKMSSVKAIHVAEGNTCFESIDGVLFSADNKTLLAYPRQRSAQEYVVPSGVESIASWSFTNCSNTESVVLSDTVTKINSYAFYGAYISDIHIPGSVSSIGEGAFMSCSNLRGVYVPATVMQIGDYVFDGTEVSIFAPSGSVAYNCALENEYPAVAFKDISSMTVYSENAEIKVNQGGWYNTDVDEEGNSYEWYQYTHPGYSLTFNFTDGTSETYTYGEFYDNFGFWPTVTSD